MDWLNTLDFELALVNCHKDFLGDWYRDPWGWPEFDWVVANRPELLAERLNSEGVRRVAKVDVPKENFATRPAVVLDPLDRLVYQALVDRISGRLSSNLVPWAYGWRLPRQDPNSGRYVPNRDEWTWYRSRLKRLAGEYPAALLTDIVSFFASIPATRLSERIVHRSRGAVSARLVDMLVRWDADVPGRTGIPQRCLASSLLANTYLQSVDEEVQSHAPRTHERVGAARWMDDYWLFGTDTGRLRQAQVSIEAAVREIGLNVGSAKTLVLEGDQVGQAVASMEHSAVDQGLAQEPPDTTALDELVEITLGHPEQASRTSIRFLTSRLRDRELWGYSDTLLDATPRMPHGADHLARLFRQTETWRDLETWYVEYSASTWNILDWTSAQLATMFPSEQLGNGAVADYLSERIAGHPPIVLAAVAVQRVAAWRPDVARQAIRTAARSAADPQERRLLALASVTLEDEPAFIRGLLREFEENRVTLEMIEDRDFRPLPTSADFR